MPLVRYTQECLEAAQVNWEAETGRDGRPVHIRVFENGFIEHVLGQAHPITPILWFGPVIAYFIYSGVTGGTGVLDTLGLVAFGWLIWSLMEYLLHRFVFHFTATSERGRFNSFMMHGYHHLYENDPMRLVAPPLMSWPLAAVLSALWWAVFGAYWMPVMAGTIIGYIAYDWTHYYTHHFRPTTRIGKFLRRYHMLHHHKFHDANFGISSPLWDFAFRTYRAHKSDLEAQALSAN